MVYSAAFCTLAVNPGLKQKEFADSKTLTEAKREALFESIAGDATMGHLTEVVSAPYICAKALATEKVGLNELAGTATEQLIARALDKGVNLQEIYVDTVGDAGRYQVGLSSARWRHRSACEFFSPWSSLGVLCPTVQCEGSRVEISIRESFRPDVFATAVCMCACRAGCPNDFQA